MTNRKSRKHTAFLWHRRIGLVAIILVIILSITGLLLNHTERLSLDSRHVDSALLLNWYGLEPSSAPVTYTAGDVFVSQWGEQLFYANRPVSKDDPPLKGAIATEQFVVIAFDASVLMLTFDGEIIERIPTGTSFASIQRLGQKYGRPVVETADQLAYMADEHIIDWDLVMNEDIAWAQATSLDAEQMQALKVAFRGNGLSLERVLLDLHSGRLFGSWGVYVMDAAAIALLWLSGSGLWVWTSRSRKQRRKKHFQKHHRHSS